MTRDTAAAAGATLVGLAALALTSHRTAPRALAVNASLREHAPAIDPGAAVRAARQMNRAAGMIAASVLADSAIEHYRGSFHNKAMVTPLVAATLSLIVSAHGNADKRPERHRARDAVYATAGLTGLVGTCFHLFNISKKPGGFSWQNLFYSAPIGAPAALTLSGAVGFLSERVRDTTPGFAPAIGGISAGRAVAAATSVGLLGTVAEAGLLHFRGAYHNPFMFLPVTIPPITAALIGGTAFGRSSGWHKLARFWLRLTALTGFAGAGFHMFGVARGMGGWRNWSQNVLNGPPIPALPASPGWR
jgi:hypothetical protein